MKINKIYAVNFRNYGACNLDFSSMINVFYGQNAQGKTNILESIYMLSDLKSPRTSTMTDLINFNSQNFEVYSLTCPSDDSDSDNPENLLLKTCFKLWFFIQNYSQQYFEKHFQDTHAEYHLIPAESEVWPTSICTRSLGNIETCF